jgi:hypothetical protein
VDLVDPIDMSNNELRVSKDSQRTYLHGECQEKSEYERFILRLVVGALFIEEGE